MGKPGPPGHFPDWDTDEARAERARLIQDFQEFSGELKREQLRLTGRDPYRAEPIFWPAVLFAIAVLILIWL